MSQMKATTSLTDLASTGAATKSQSGFVAGIVGKAKAAVEITRSFLGRAYDVVEEKAASAKVATIGKGRTASAFVVGRLNDVKARGLTALSQVKKAVTEQVASVNVKALAVLDDAKVRVVKVGSSIQQRALGYIPAGVKTQVVSVYGYTTEKFLVVKGTAASLSESTRERVLAQVTSAQIMTLNTIESAKTQAAYLGDVVVEHTPIPVKSGVTTVYNSAATKASAAHQKITSVSDKAVEKASEVNTAVKAKASEVNTAVREVASDPKAQSTAIGAAGGAVTMGATGGAVGLASGSMVGAVVGLVPALFTFGLSIPIGAMLGGGAGLCVGTAVGGTTGLVAGGAAGYKKDSIASGTKVVLAQAGDCAQYAKEKASASRQFVQEQASSVRARGRVMIGGTGGTETQESD